MRIFIKLAFLLLILLNVYACGGNTNKAGEIDASRLFKLNCQLCHGAKGDLGANGSKNIQLSEFSLEERIHIITYGKGTMLPFNDQLSKDEIAALAAYTFQLK